jgi:hypothetical protein
VQIVREEMLEPTASRPKWGLKKSHRLAWPASAYRLSFDGEKYQEARIALALNGAHVRVEEGLFWILQQEGWYHTCHIEYVAAWPPEGSTGA